MRPREAFRRHGASVSDVELIALILGTGVAGRDAVEVSTAVLTRFGGLLGLARADLEEIAAEHGIGTVRAMRILAAMEAGRRSLRPADPPRQVRSSQDVWDWFSPSLAARREEELHGIYLDRRHRVLAHHALTRGCDGYTVVEARQVFRPAVAVGASAVVLVHNHPSGDPTPSQADREVTRRIAAAGVSLGISLADHVIVGTDGWASMAEQGYLPFVS
jgi:DNA repair protein RadC